MKKTRKTARVLLSICMAVLLCLSAFTMAGAVDEPPAAARSIYYDNYYTGWTDVYCYAWNAAGEYNAAWPGEPMTLTNGSCYKVDVAAAYTKVIFNNGAGAQTFDLDLLAKYDTFFGNNTKESKVNGFWLNQSNYSKIYFTPADFWGEGDCYVSFWGANIPQSWPGIKMDKTSGTATAAYIPTAMISNVIINNGGNGKQTETLTTPLTSNSIGLTGEIIGQDQYGNDIYEVKYNTPGPG